jgi:two-component system phosphate regulon sensor histidine kinase PhoR
VIRSLRAKLTVYGLLSLLLVFAALGLFLALDARHYLLRLAAEEMREQALLLGQQYESLLAKGRASDSLQAFTLAQSGLLGKRISIIDRSGAVVSDSDIRSADIGAMDNHLVRPEILRSNAEGWGYAMRYSRTLRQDMIYLAVSLKQDGTVWGYCRIAWPWQRFIRFQRRLVVSLVIALAAAVLLLLASTSLIWDPAARAIKRTGAVAQRIAAGEFQARASISDGPAETMQIARSLNAMAESWEQAAGRLREKTAQLESILGGMSEGVVVIGPEGKVVLANPAAAAMMGTDREGAPGKLLLELIRLPQMEQLVSGDRDRVEIEINGRILLAHASRSDDPAIGQVLVLLDITDIRRLEGLRRDFVANVSHELKTPLSAVVGYAEALRDGAKDVPAQRDDFLERIERQAGRMTKIVNDLLDLTGLETGSIRLDRQPLVVRQLIDRALDAVAPQVRGRGLRVALPDGPALGLTIAADEGRITTALVNLLDNAAKFAPAGSTITVSAAAVPGGVKLAVSDQGPGIPAEHLPRLFERFYRVDRSRSRELGGTGLGLSIVKHVAETHGGSAGVESEPGKGSTFWIVVPAAP